MTSCWGPKAARVQGLGEGRLWGRQRLGEGASESLSALLQCPVTAGETGPGQPGDIHNMPRGVEEDGAKQAPDHQCQGAPQVQIAAVVGRDCLPLTAWCHGEQRTPEAVPLRESCLPVQEMSGGGGTRGWVLLGLGSLFLPQKDCPSLGRARAPRHLAWGAPTWLGPAPDQ